MAALPNDAGPVNPMSEEPQTPQSAAAKNAVPAEGIEAALSKGQSIPLSATSNFPAWKKHTHNYHSLAGLMTEHPPLSTFRRFATLNNKNLLYLQAELSILEDELERLEKADQRADDHNRRQFQWEARRLIESNGPQYAKFLEIRAKLEKYNETLLQHTQLHALPAPYGHNVDRLRGWLQRPDYGAMFLEDVEDVWFTDDTHPSKADLVDLSARTQGDRFSRWITYTAVPWLHRHVLQRPRHLISRRRRTFGDPGGPKELEADAAGGLGADGTGGGRGKGVEPSHLTFNYSDRTLEHVAEVASVVMSSLLPTASIFALNYIPQEDTALRLVFILVFSALFATALAIFTTAKRIEIFAGVATLASIQVVFIGTNNCDCGPS